MADDLLIQLALTMDGELGREERRARARAALRAQYVAGLERAMHEVVSALNRGRAEKASGAALTVLTALEINLRELAEQAKREGTTP